MGNAFSEKQNIYVFDWIPPEPNDLFITVQDPVDLPHPLHGKILIPFSSTHQKRQLIARNHHQVLLLDDVPELYSHLSHQFKGVPIISEEDLINDAQKCLEMSFNSHQCPIPLVLQRFNQSLLKNYMNAFLHYGVNVQYYDRLEHFLNSACSNAQMICSNVELEQLSCRIQNQTFKRNTEQKMVILCFCNKDEYSLPKKTELAMQSNSIEVHFFQNMLEIVEKVNGDLLISPETEGNVLSSGKERILFYLNEKEKEHNYLVKMGRKMERSIRNLKVVKVYNKADLVDKIREEDYSIVLFSNDSKEMKGHLEIYQTLEEEGLEDRAIFLRRDSEMGTKILQKIESTIYRPKFMKQSIIDKPLIFYGTLDTFKYVLKYYPKLSFKKFIDSSKETQILKPFLKRRNEVVMTHLKVCDCVEGWEQIHCKMIYVRTRTTTTKIDKKASSQCMKENWMPSEREIISYFQGQEQRVLGLNFDYGCRKMTAIGKIISQTFSKLKEKKTVLMNQMYGSIFLFSCEYYFLDQISGFITKYFTSKLLGSYEKPCLLNHFKFQLYRELLRLHQTAGIEEQVIQKIEKDQSRSIFYLSDKIVQMAVEHPYFLEEVNSIWQLFLHQDRPEYLSNCQILLFLMLLSFNKASFTEFHNETLQHVTLKIKAGLISYEDEAFSVFAAKTKNSFVYNLNFLICEEVPYGQTPQRGDIFIRIEGSELNNFGLYLPVWRKQSRFLIAPLTKFELILTKKSPGLTLKLSLNSQQKMLEKMTEHFLQDKVVLRLFNESRQVRTLDHFLQSMCSGKFETAGFIIKKMVKEEQIANQELLNAYIILHHLKCGDLEEASNRLQKDKYYDILSKLVATCREGSSIEAVHSEFTAECNNQETPVERHSFDSVNNSQEMDLTSNATMDFRSKFKRSEKRSPSDAFKRAESLIQKTKGRRIPIPIRHHQRKNAETSVMGTDNEGTEEEEEEVKIKIFSPANESINTSSQDNFEQNKRITAAFSSLLDNSKSQSTVKEAFQCSLSRLNSCTSEKSFISDLFQFEDHINENSEEQTPLVKRTSKEKPSTFLQIQSERIKNAMLESEETSQGTGTATGKFNFGPSKHNQDDQEENQLIEEESIVEIMPAVEEEESEKLSESEIDKKMLSTSSDFFKFSLGFNPVGQKLIPHKRKSIKLPRSSIQQNRASLLGHFGLPNLGNIEQENCLPSNNNLSKPNIRASSAQKQNDEQSQTVINRRSEDRKLFTFFNNQPFKPRFSGQGANLKIPSSSLMVSQDSNVELPQSKLSGGKKDSLFCIFGGDEQKSQLQSLNSISSIDLDDAEPVHPEQLMRTATHD